MTIASEPPQDATEWPELQRHRRAIVVVDVVESVRLMQANEADVIDRWRRFVNEVRTQVLPIHGGRLVKSLGDGLLLEFESVSFAAQAAVEMHRRVAHYNTARATTAELLLRVGVHVSDVVFDELDIYGAGVNLAARLAALAGPGQSVVSSAARAELVEGLDARFDDLGDCYVKHLDQPIRAHRLRGPASEPAEAMPHKLAAVDLRPPVAVLPFACLGSAPGEQGVVGDIFADDVSTALSRCAELQVISRLSTAAFKGRVPSAEQLALLGAHYIVSGSYHLFGDTVRVRAELSHLAERRVLWADGFNASVAALLQGAEPSVERMVRGIGEAIVARELRAASSLPMPNVESHALMSAAISMMHGLDAGQFDTARAMLEHLRERHWRLPQPHAWIAKWHVLRVVQGRSPDPAQDGQHALDAGNRALDGDAHSSLALTMQGLVHAYLMHDFAQARRLYEDALGRNPSEAMAKLLLGTMHAFLGEGDAAWALTQDSLRLTPLDPLRYFYLSLSASAAIAAGRYDDAIDLAQRSLRANRAHLSTHRALALAQSLSGRVEEARATVAEIVRMEPGFTVAAFRARYPGRDHAPEYTRTLSDAFRAAGLPE